MTDTSLLKAGVMGWPVGHSLSPRLHGFWLEAYGISGSYTGLAVEPCELLINLKELDRRGFKGVNLTVPHKEAALAIVDQLDPAAKRIGALNLVVVAADGTLQGRNTDAYGFTQNLLTEGFKPSGRPALVLGAGGAARAVLVALTDMGVTTIYLANRTQERAEKLATAFSSPSCQIHVVSWKNLSDAMKNISLLVNTTSLGMVGQPSLDVDLHPLPSDCVVTDIVYTPLLTELLADAQNRGHKIIDGLGMLLHQARPAFAAFFGKDPEVTERLRQFVLEGRQ